MSKSIQDIESFIREMDLTCEIPREGTCVVTGLSDVNNVVITLAGPVVVFRVKVLDIPRHNREDLFRTLLELNATEMMHGAYGAVGECLCIETGGGFGVLVVPDADRVLVHGFVSCLRQRPRVDAQDYARLTARATPGSPK
mgnify:CR=1 FL=1